MTQYCPSCRGENGARIEMEAVSSGWTSVNYQCPCCSELRQVRNGLATRVTAEEIQPKKSSFLGKVAKVAVGTIVVATVIANSDKK